VKAIAVIAFLVVILIVAKIAYGADQQNCKTGQTSGFVAMNPQPFLIGQMPSTFTKDSRYFQTKYNCKHQDVFVRRVDQGQYDVKFPNIKIRVAIATAISDEGVAASTYPIDTVTQRVVMRGPSGILRDVAFSVVVY
jgi:hypothetical protein